MSGVDYDEAARAILFDNLTVTDLLDKHGLVFRKNKTIIDLKNAVSKAIADGNGKVENELSWVALRIQDVLKENKKVKGA